MSITDTERTELFSRIGQLEGARVNEAAHTKSSSSKSSNGNGGGAKAFASILVIISIIGGMAAIVRPIQQQIHFLSEEVRETRVKTNIETEKSRERIAILEKDLSIITERVNNGIKDRYYTKDALKDYLLLQQKIENLNLEIKHLKELIPNVYRNTTNN